MKSPVDRWEFTRCAFHDMGEQMPEENIGFTDIDFPEISATRGYSLFPDRAEPCRM